MDLRLFWGVIKRYKRLSIGGTLFAVLLAVLAYGTPSLKGGMPTVVPRGAVTYESDAQLLITQGNGPYGRADSKTVQVGDPGYMSSLSPIYAGLANGDAVQNAIRDAKVPGTLSAAEGVDQNTGAYTPFVNLTAQGPTAADAAKLDERGITAFQNYVAQMEASTSVPVSSRVTLQVLRSGLPPKLASGHKITIPALVLVAVLAALIGLLFSLENRDPQTAVKLGRVPASAVAQAALAAYGNGNGNGVAAPARSSNHSPAFGPQPADRHDPVHEAGEAPAAARSAVMDKLMRR